MPANVQGTFTSVGEPSAVMDADQGQFLFNTEGCNASNTLKTQKSTNNGASWTDVTTFNSEQIGTVITPAAGEQYRVVPVSLQSFREIRFKMSRENRGLSFASQYLGQVAGQCRVPTVGGGSVQLLARTRHLLRSAVTTIQVAYPNYYLDAACVEQPAGGVSTITGSIEYPPGNLIQLKWSTVPSIAVASGAISPLSDPVTINAPSGAEIFVQTYFTTLGGYVTTSSLNGQDTVNGEKMRVAAAGLTDQTMNPSSGWAGGASTNNYTYSPVLIVGQTTVPSVLILGDSLAELFNDTYTGASGDIGYPGRCVGPLFGYTKHARQGTSASQFLSSTTNCLALSQYFSHVLCEFGVNDLASVSAAACLASLQAISALFPTKKFLQSTITNRGASSNSWIDSVGQTPTVTVSDRIVQLNDFIRAGLVPGVGYIEFNDVLSTARNSKLWKSDGNPNTWTSDGIHGSQFAYLQALAANIINQGNINR